MTSTHPFSDQGDPQFDNPARTLHGLPHYERQAARVVVLDATSRILLLHYPAHPESVDSMERWLLPGGGLDSGEDHETAARRELLEETGLQVEAFEAEVLRRDFTIRWKEGTLYQHERIYLARIDEVDPHLETDYRGPRWWTTDELRAERPSTRPFELADILQRILDHGPPAEPEILPPLIAPPVRELWARQSGSAG